MASAPQQSFLKGWVAAVSRLLGLRPAKPEVVLPSGVALINGIGWNQFELMAADGFRHRGYVVSETGGNGGRAVDMVLTRGHEQFLVDCKPWRAKAVGVAPLRELHGLVTARGAAGGFVLTSGVFTPEAVRFSEGRNIRLIDGTQLRDLLYSREEKTLPVVIRREGPFLDTTLPPAAWRVRSQACPVCGGAMVERVMSQAGQADRRVLGCVHAPLCEGTRELPG